MRTAALVLALGWLLAACGASSASAGTSSPGHREGSAAPAKPAAAGPSIVDEAAVRQVLAARTPSVLLFMATGCSSCAAQATALVTAAEGRNVRLIGVDLSFADDPSTLRSFLEDAQLGSLPIIWTIDRDQRLDQLYQVQTLDETVGVVAGAVRFHNPSAADAGQLRQQIARLT